VDSAEIAKQIDMPFGGQTHLGERLHTLIMSLLLLYSFSQIILGFLVIIIVIIILGVSYIDLT